VSMRKRSALARARLILGLTQCEIASRIGVRQSCVSMIENGQRGGRNDIRRKISTLLGISEDLLFRKDTESGSRD
jgi:transcriptional regulator with XRE-family HTH domain